MGMWDIRPWDNDQAADWYAGFMVQSNFRELWLAGINLQADSEDADAVRAAAALFMMLGRVYIWPIEHYDEDLALTISQLTKTLECPEYEECDELINIIKTEIQELENRRTPGYQAENPRSSWW